MLSEKLSQFVQYLTFEKHFSDHTVRNYNHDIEQWIQHLEKEHEVKNLNEVHHRMIRGWMVQLMEDKIAARSITRKLSSLRSFYRFLMREGLVDENPLSRIQAPKMEKKLPVFVEERPMQRLIDEEGDIEFSDDYEGRRNRLIILLFYSTGMRLSELTGIKTKDIDLRRQVIKVLGKRNKERILPLTKELQVELEEFMALNKIQNFNGEYLLLTNKGEKLYAKLVYRVVKKYLTMVTPIEKRSPHVLRHTFATHLLNKGADLNAIKELLGHANLAATQVYTHNSIERLKNIYKTRHPRA